MSKVDSAAMRGKVMVWVGGLGFLLVAILAVIVFSNLPPGPPQIRFGRSLDSKTSQLMGEATVFALDAPHQARRPPFAGLGTSLTPVERRDALLRG